MKKGKVIVAMSGGVDSSVAAGILKKKGYEVIGVFMHFWSPSEKKKEKFLNRCCSLEAQEDARKVAQKLRIPFYTLNFSSEFKRKVVDYFIEEYKRGRTPNPCIACNEEIKFGLLFEKLQKLAADFLATGHYARVVKKKNGYVLMEAKDNLKDQSYFLYRINKKILPRLFFPLGNISKGTVKKLAKSWHLPVCEKRESTEICFIPGASLKNFLEQYLTLKPGKIINEQGETLGEHHGLPLYTLGQRAGLFIGEGGPYYVLKKNMKKNILVVTNNKEKLMRKEIHLRNLHWINEPRKRMFIALRIRHQAPKISANIIKRNKTWHFILNEKVFAPTAGQSAVVYCGKELLGGGVII